MVAIEREVIWTLQARAMLDEAVAYVANDSVNAAVQLLNGALNMAESLATFSERGRIVPEIEDPNTRELFIQNYRLIYEIAQNVVQVLAFLHGYRDFYKWYRAHQGEVGE